MKKTLFLLLLANWATAAFAATDDQDIDVKVARDGAAIDMDISFRVNACRREAWQVLTDYNGMARFVSTLDSSAIVRQSGNTLEVAQKGKVAFGLLSFPFSNLRRIELEPFREIRSLIVEGSMNSTRFTTTIVDDRDAIRIVQHGHVVPDTWVPPLIGPAVIAAGTRRQWQEFRAEIIRRQAAAESQPITAACR